MKKVYFISGLGASDAAFANLRLPGIEPVHLNWMAPDKKESIEHYAQRMSDRIPANEEPLIVALSFGGMISAEIAKLRPIKKLILISSAKTCDELPPYFRIGRSIPIHKIFPLKKLGSNELVMKHVFGAKTERQKRALRAIIETSMSGFNEWAVNAVVHWCNKTMPVNVVHIHGTKDILLPFKFVKADYAIKGGTHLMVLTRAQEVSDIILKELNKVG